MACCLLARLWRGWWQSSHAWGLAWLRPLAKGLAADLLGRIYRITHRRRRPLRELVLQAVRILRCSAAAHRCTTAAGADDVRLFPQLRRIVAGAAADRWRYGYSLVASAMRPALSSLVSIVQPGLCHRLTPAPQWRWRWLLGLRSAGGVRFAAMAFARQLTCKWPPEGWARCPATLVASSNLTCTGFTPLLFAGRASAVSRRRCSMQRFSNDWRRLCQLPYRA